MAHTEECAPPARPPARAIPGTTIDKVLPRLGGFREAPLDAGSQYVQPASIMYELDGAAPLSRESARSRASVCGSRGGGVRAWTHVTLYYV